MKRIHLLAMAVCLIPAVTANAQNHGKVANHSGPVKTRVTQVQDAVADAYEQRHLSQYSYAGHVYRGGAGGAQYGGPQYGGVASYYGGDYCRSCDSGDLNCYPRHNYTYGYQRPRNLVYPQRQATGGAVVYPYYTHKGPSDFFRK